MIPGSYGWEGVVGMMLAREKKYNILYLIDSKNELIECNVI